MIKRMEEFLKKCTGDGEADEDTERGATWDNLE